ncbi:hypothetical protein [Streptomyces sp. NBC_01497]|uniref:hypothetical protein n=1 Tax=Streptomyces sp. NBC_01497 TaxID=2903885 RepID=UPI002E36237B|nr:hypothetical protein [Streptomyces sp. NBC_01497]
MTARVGGSVFRVHWVPGTDRLHGVCFCGAARDFEDPVDLWDWLLAHPEHPSAPDPSTRVTSTPDPSTPDPSVPDLPTRPPYPVGPAHPATPARPAGTTPGHAT